MPQGIEIWIFFHIAQVRVAGLDCQLDQGNRARRCGLLGGFVRVCRAQGVDAGGGVKQQS